jgi:hypothetical protein
MHFKVAGGSTVFHVDPPTEVSADCQRAFAVTQARVPLVFVVADRRPDRPDQGDDRRLTG